MLINLEGLLIAVGFIIAGAVLTIIGLSVMLGTVIENNTLLMLGPDDLSKYDVVLGIRGKSAKILWKSNRTKEFILEQIKHLSTDLDEWL